MKKRIFTLLLAGCMALSLCACDLSDPNGGEAADAGTTSQGVPILMPAEWDQLLAVYFDTAAGGDYGAEFAANGITGIIFLNFYSNGFGADFPTYFIFESAEAAAAYVEMPDTVITREYQDQTGAVGTNTYEIVGNVVAVTMCDVYISGMASMSYDLALESYASVPGYTCYEIAAQEDYVTLLENAFSGEPIELET